MIFLLSNLFFWGILFRLLLHVLVVYATDVACRSCLIALFWWGIYMHLVWFTLVSINIHLFALMFVLETLNTHIMSFIYFLYSFWYTLPHIYGIWRKHAAQLFILWESTRLPKLILCNIHWIETYRVHEKCYCLF